jgi:hypothetical protein
MLEARTGADLDFAAGTHDAYAPQRHIRAVLAVHGIGWLVVDRVTGPGPIAADTWWHLHPSWRPVLRDGAFELQGAAGLRLAFASTAPDLAIVEDEAGYSPEYGRIEPAVAIRASRTARGICTIAAFIPASPALSHRPAIVEAAAGEQPRGWTAARFHIRAGDSEFQVTVPFPADAQAEAHAASWPQPCIEQLVKSCVE